MPSVTHLLMYFYILNNSYQVFGAVRYPGQLSNIREQDGVFCPCQVGAHSPMTYCSRGPDYITFFWTLHKFSDDSKQFVEVPPPAELSIRLVYRM